MIEPLKNSAKPLTCIPTSLPPMIFSPWPTNIAGSMTRPLPECHKAIDLAKSDHFLLTQLAHIYAMSGKRAESRRLLAEITNEPKHRYFPPTYVATVYVALGDKERAFQWLDKAYSERDWGLVGLRVFPEFDDVRSDPRFSDLLKRMNLE